MTDKEQIIIDGVDILDCDNYYVKQETDQVKCDLSGEYCRENKNCFYKQLARKTQECKSLKEQIEILQNNYDTATRDCNEEIARLEQKCEELKKQLMQKDEVNIFFNIPIEGWSGNPCDICESKNNYEQLKQECEELRVAYNKAQDIIGRVNGANELKSYSLQESIKECDRYHKALEEIEEIVKSLNENRMCFYDDINDCSNCDMNTDCNYLRKSKILNIIDKAKGEGNALYQ